MHIIAYTSFLNTYCLFSGPYSNYSSNTAVNSPASLTIVAVAGISVAITFVVSFSLGAMMVIIACASATSQDNSIKILSLVPLLLRFMMLLALTKHSNAMLRWRLTLLMGCHYPYLKVICNVCYFDRCGQ